MLSKYNIIKELEGRAEILNSMKEVDYKHMNEFGSGEYREGYIAGLLFCLGCDSPLFVAHSYKQTLQFIKSLKWTEKN